MNTKIKHSKIKNTGILFELLTRQITVDIMNDTKGKAVSILKNYFSPKTELGKEYGLYPRIHSDEFKNIGATSLAIDIDAVSADHLMNISEEEIIKMSNSSTSAVILPGTAFCLGKNFYAPYLKMKNAGIEIAIATDYNPGSCNIQSMPFIILLSLIYMQMDIIDAIYSSTYVPAKILKVDKSRGSIEIGKAADLIIWDVKTPIEIAYNSNFNPIMSVIKSGKTIF